MRAKLVAEAKAKEAFQGGVSTLLAVKTNPAGAVLYLDGQPIGRSDGLGLIRIHDIYQAGIV